MIIETRNCDIFSCPEKHIAFPVNTEGFNNSGFSGQVWRRGWPELAEFGKCELGTVITKEINGIIFYGLVCYSLSNGFMNMEVILKKCFDSIPYEGHIATTQIGAGPIDRINGANRANILRGMQTSKANLILYKNV